MRRMCHGHFQASKPVTRIAPIRYASFDHNAIRIQPVAATKGNIALDWFRSAAWVPSVPLHMRDSHRLPAMMSWFSSGGSETGSILLGDKLLSFGDVMLSYELVTSSDNYGLSAGCSLDCLQGFQTWLKDLSDEQHGHVLSELVDRLVNSAEAGHSHFLQFNAPLNFFTKAAQYNRDMSSPSCHIKQLYIAQSDIRSLPAPLREDLPVPDIVGQAGKGDIYNSSIWLGLQPTYTPLHRDPNPNLFCQLAGSKAVRLLRPRDGQFVFQDVRRKLGVVGNSRFRGAEMMDGPERDGLHHATWILPHPSREIWEAVLAPGDALFIPQGWWHSVRSVGRDAEINASANWWFR